MNTGKLEGNPSDLPPAPTFSEGWQLGTPDLIVEMPETYLLAADGEDVYRHFVIPVPVETERWVKANGVHEIRQETGSIGLEHRAQRGRQGVGFSMVRKSLGDRKNAVEGHIIITECS